MSRAIAILVFVACCTTACGDDTAPAPSPNLNLTGSWRGAVGIDLGAAQMTWTLTHTNTAVTGPAVLTLANGIVLMNGTVTGTLAGAVLTYSLNVPAGGVPLLPACSGQVAGTMTATSPNLLTGGYQLVSSTCTTVLTGLANGTLTMTRL